MKSAASCVYIRSLTVLSAMILLTGCWDRHEVNDLALITAAAIDQLDDHTVELSVQIFSPKSGGGSGQGNSGGESQGSGQVFLRSATGASLPDAMSRLQLEISRRLFWGHADTFIFTRKLAEAGIRDEVDFIIRSPQARERANAFVFEGNPKEILSNQPMMERDSSELLREMAKMQTNLNVTVKDLSIMLSGQTGAAALPFVRKVSEKMAPGQPIPYIVGAALFRKDKLVGTLNEQETRGLLWVRGEINQAIVSVQAPSGDGDIASQMFHSSSKLVPQVKGDVWSVNLFVDAEDDLLMNGSSMDVMSPKFTAQVEKELEDKITARIEQAAAKVQQQDHVDVFGFADLFHRKFPKQWKKIKDRWEVKFPEVQVNIETKVHVRRSGMTSSGGNMPESEVREQ